MKVYGILRENGGLIDDCKNVPSGIQGLREKKLTRYNKGFKETSKFLDAVFSLSIHDIGFPTDNNIYNTFALIFAWEVKSLKISFSRFISMIEESSYDRRHYLEDYKIYVEELFSKCISTGDLSSLRIESTVQKCIYELERLRNLGICDIDYYFMNLMEPAMKELRLDKPKSYEELFVSIYREGNCTIQRL